MKKSLLLIIFLVCILTMVSCISNQSHGIDLEEIFFNNNAPSSYDMLSTKRVDNYNYGDLNDDGIIDQDDIKILFRHIYDPVTYGIENIAMGDVSNDGEITNVDLLTMYKYICDPNKYPIDGLFKDTVNVNAFGEAYTILESFSYNTGTLPNAWRYDNRFDIYNTTGTNSNTIVDVSNEQFFSFIREFDSESDGLLRLELLVELASSNGGAYITFADADGDNIVTVTEEGGYFAIKGTEEYTSDIPVSSSSASQYVMIMEIDLDANTASLIVNNTVAGTVNIANDAEVSCLILGTEKEGTGTVTLLHAVLDKNYVLGDRFMAMSELTGQKPATWNVTGDFKLRSIASEYYYNVYSVKADSTAGSVSTANKGFEKIYGKISFETYILLPEKTDGASVALTSGGVDILKFETKNGNIVMGDTVLHDYAANVWQCLHIDADTATGIADIYINGKKKAEIEFNARYFDGVNINFAPQKDAVMWFDDVMLYNLYEYSDYPEYPQVAESTDYNVGVNVCWLWRDSNSGEGWNAISGYPELEPYLGYYDEGLRETADWELKYMAEHGIDFVNVCWYSPGHDVTDPIKKMYRSYSALHDGYMYAKYSDLVKFCILWENDTRGFDDFEQFKDIIWAYWKEYYFSDDRYMRLDNKALITVWNKDLLIDMFGGEEEFISAVEFMENELIEMGYDGLILLFTTQGYETSGDYAYSVKIGYDGSYAYHYGPYGNDPQLQIDYNTSNIENALASSSYHVPTVSVGFNSLPRFGVRYDLITAEDHLTVCENIKELLATYNTGTWKDNTVIISTWNEFSEGTYIFPTEGTGFSYLENIRKAFTNDTSDHSEIDVKPTEEQTNRVSHMNPDNYSKISRFEYELSETQEGQTNTSNYRKVKDVTRGFGTWKISHNAKSFSYSTWNRYWSGTTTAVDSGIHITLSKSIVAEDAPILHIQLQSSEKGVLEVYFATPENSTFDGIRRDTTNITTTNQYVDYYFRLDTLSDWAGDISRLRIDIDTAVGATFRIKLIEFMTYPAEDPNAISVEINHTEYLAAFYPDLLSDGDYEIVANNSFFSLMMVYHEWDRFNETLTLKAKDERTLVFTVGSSVAYIDGVATDLGYTFRLRDGLPIFKVKSLCDMLGYKCEMKDKKLIIQSCSDSAYALIEKIQSGEEYPISGEWTFDYADADHIADWVGRDCFIGISDNGTLQCIPNGAEPTIYKPVGFHAESYSTFIVEYRVEDYTGIPPVFCFKTVYGSPETKECSSVVTNNGIVTVTFDLSDHWAWNGQIAEISLILGSNYEIDKMTIK